ncbi:hypothetical protein H6P81_018087 [Aristolochia fimbriata]|uniref:Aminotransferase-like plant mobile domain-containing protein n=1 Tax=Aristolochia fimbriata TaxID=158543 RepID=A0AAV7E4B4_ARIFI|nr:hypothetical protein H6P81_018087 [Aristolochia fimbriata]
MAAPSVNLIGGLRAFDHVVTVGGESLLTLALYMEGEASRIDSGSLHAVNQLPLPQTFADDFMDGGIVRNFHTPDAKTLDTPLPFLFKWTTLLLGRCRHTLRNASIYYGLWASIFLYSCYASMVQAFIDTWYPERNTLITCQGKLSITLLDMDRIFGLPISGQFYDEVCPMVADFTDVRSSALPYNCQYLFLACHRLFQCSESPTAPLSTAFWVSFWFCTDDDVIPVHDPWTAWHNAYEKGAATLRERTTTEQDVFNFLRVMLGSSGEEEGYDRDRSHPRRQRLKGKQQVGAPSANKKMTQFATLNGASTFAKKKTRGSSACFSPFATDFPSSNFGDKASSFFAPDFLSSCFWRWSLP